MRSTKNEIMSDGKSFIRQLEIMKQIQTAAFGIPEFELRSSEVYRQKIESWRMVRLLIKKRQTGKPITRLVAEALDIYLDNVERG